MSSAPHAPPAPTEAPATGLIKHVISKADLPPHSMVSLTGAPLNFPITVEDQIAILLLKSTRSSLLNKGDVWLLATEEASKKVHYHSYKKDIQQKGGYKIVHQATIEPLLLRALHESGTSAQGQEYGTKTELIKIYEKIVKDALDERVSDIHIEKRKTKAQIRMRKHGQMLEYSELGPKDCTDLVAVIHNVLAENKAVTFRENDYQSASVNTIVAGVECKLRYQSLPVYPDGFDVVLRVLPIGSDEEGFVQLDTLGYASSQVRELIEISGRPVGAMVIAGTTGSGKSTTLKNLLMFINASRGYRCKIFTIEDPPEYKIPRVSQIPVIRTATADYSKKSPFYEPLVATMRGDPDILMIGEIRDHFTGDGLKKATQSGHQVLTTVHASSALGIIERLADFQISPSVMGSPEFLNGLIYQKLVPTVCKHCCVMFSDKLAEGGASEALMALGRRLEKMMPLDMVRMRGAGCDRCGKMQVSGRSVCAEIIVPDFQMLKCFRTQRSIEAYEYWRSLSDRDITSDNMQGKTVLEHALTKVMRGEVDPHDVEELFGPVDSAERLLEQMRAERAREAGEASSLPGVKAAAAAPVAAGDVRRAPYVAADV